MTSFLDMTQFVQYDPLTGEIEAAGHMQKGGIVHSQLIGRHVVEGMGDPATHRVDLETMTVVAKSQEGES